MPVPRLTDAPIDLARLTAEVTAPGHGAVASFTGVVRDRHAGRTVVALAYSAYAPMAERELAAISAEVGTAHGALVAVQHRIGALALGDVAVAVAAGAPHREAAFAACRDAIDAIKRRVPIWKRERYVDGTEAWVDPTAPEGIVPVGGG